VQLILNLLCSAVQYDEACYFPSDVCTVCLYVPLYVPLYVFEHVFTSRSVFPVAGVLVQIFVFGVSFLKERTSIQCGI